MDISPYSSPFSALRMNDGSAVMPNDNRRGREKGLYINIYTSNNRISKCRHECKGCSPRTNHSAPFKLLYQQNVFLGIRIRLNVGETIEEEINVNDIKLIEYLRQDLQ